MSACLRRRAAPSVRRLRLRRRARLRNLCLLVRCVARRWRPECTCGEEPRAGHSQ
ncbi:hypothetical protein ACFFX0_25295 [Citricoccus parietis]|uniref:Uncharacterized protein n=1 Tax=Citricoccus parietis TaxID=592307 RepID=A0ABV5G6T6_9MICC